MVRRVQYLPSIQHRREGEKVQTMISHSGTVRFGTQTGLDQKQHRLARVIPRIRTVFAPPVGQPISSQLALPSFVSSSVIHSPLSSLSSSLRHTSLPLSSLPLLPPFCQFLLLLPPASSGPFCGRPLLYHFDISLFHPLLDRFHRIHSLSVYRASLLVEEPIVG